MRFRSMRLAHDTLAPLVRERYDRSDRPAQRARRILRNRLPEWEGCREGAPLEAARPGGCRAGGTGDAGLVRR